MKTIKLLLSLLALFVFGEVAAQDYVDAINQSSKASAGHRVIYEMNVGAFTQQGTFAAAQQRLSELKTLGVDIVWLMPIYPRGGGLNSPYAATNFQQVNPSYGSIADLRNFVFESPRTQYACLARLGAQPHRHKCQLGVAASRLLHMEQRPDGSS